MCLSVRDVTGNRFQPSTSKLVYRGIVHVRLSTCIDPDYSLGADTPGMDDQHLVYTSPFTNIAADRT